MAGHADVLGYDSRPLVFAVENAGELGLAPPKDRHGVSLRTWVRSLSGMQKEALVISGATGMTWRLAADEGPYLQGHDVGPAPLAFLCAGMISSYMESLFAVASMREIEIEHVRLVLDNFYSMEGSVLRGTMAAGALAPHVAVELRAGADGETARELVADALLASPVSGLTRAPLASRFTLTHNGTGLKPTRVAWLRRPAEPDPGDQFPRVRRAGGEGEAVVRKLVEAESVDRENVGSGASLKESQKRTLHLRGACSRRDDELKVVDVDVISPIGSTFRFLSEEAPGFGGLGRAPDAATYLSAGFGFCFMTQFGRYAEITKSDLGSYRIVQDTFLSRGDVSPGEVRPGHADAVETHVHLETGEDEDFARAILDMAEQTCFLHALCRPELEPELVVEGSTRA